MKLLVGVAELEGQRELRTQGSVEARPHLVRIEVPLGLLVEDVGLEIVLREGNELLEDLEVDLGVHAESLLVEGPEGEGRARALEIVAPGREPELAADTVPVAFDPHLREVRLLGGESHDLDQARVAVAAVEAVRVRLELVEVEVDASIRLLLEQPGAVVEPGVVGLGCAVAGREDVLLELDVAPPADRRLLEEGVRARRRSKEDVVRVAHGLRAEGVRRQEVQDLVGEARLERVPVEGERSGALPGVLPGAHARKVVERLRVERARGRGSGESEGHEGTGGGGPTCSPSPPQLRPPELTSPDLRAVAAR